MLELSKRIVLYQYTFGETMNNLLSAPANFSIIAGNKSATASWDSVPTADGYRIDYYLVSNPSKRIKYRYSQTNKKKILGFQNGTEYFACVSAFKYVDGIELFGPKSECVYFSPISLALTADNVVCLHVGEEKQLEWEYMNSKPEVKFSVEECEVASIDADGVIKGKKSGSTRIMLSLDSDDVEVNEEKTHFVVNVYVERDLTNDHISDSSASSFDIVIAGDLMCSVGVQASAHNHSYDFSDIFSHRILNYLKNADYVIGNLETMCDDTNPFESEIYRLPRGSANNNSPSSFLYAVKEAGFNCLVTANNHNADCGMAGLKKTISKITCNNMLHSGSCGDNPIYITKGDVKVAIIALSMINNGIDDISPDPYRDLARYSNEYFLSLANIAKENNCTYTIVVMHWGRMNSTIITDTQRKTAEFLAENGADIIIGAEPHVLQRFEYIKTSTKQVPCFYSLGNFYSSMREMYENTVSGLVHIHFNNVVSIENNIQLSPDIKFVPTLCLKHNKTSAIVDLVEPIISKEHQLARQYATDMIAYNSDQTVGEWHSVALQGSSIMRDIKSYLPIRTYDEGLIISPLTIFDEKVESTGAYCNRTDNFAIDLSKSYYDKLKMSDSDFYCFDLYAAAAISIYEYKENGVTTHFTGTKKFLNSNFYKNNNDKLTKIVPSQSIELTKELLDRYINKIQTLYSHDKIILIRVKMPKMGCKQGELRNISVNYQLNNFLQLIEDYVISKLNPCVIDISDHFFKNIEIGNIFTFEKLFYIQTMEYILKYINNPSGRHYYNEISLKVWIRRIQKFYKNMTARSYQKYLLNNTDAADIIIANSSLDFTAKYQNALIKLKEDNVSLEYTENVLPESDYEVLLAVNAIQAMKQKDFTQPYSVYDVAFRYNFNILKTFSKNLSSAIGYYVTPENIKSVYKLLNNSEALELYFAKNPVTHIDIWGSCVSREVVNRVQPRLCVDNYIFKQSQLLSADAPITSIQCSDDISDYENNAWRMKTIRASIQRDGRQVLNDRHSDVLLIDFYDLICTMKKYENDFFEIDDFIERTKFYKSIKDKCSTTYLFDEFDIEDSTARMREFGEYLITLYGKNIILIIADLKNEYLDLDGNIKPLYDDGTYEEKVKYIKNLEKIFIETTNCYVIDDSRKYMASDDFPLGGAHIVHYESQFYMKAGQKLLSIIDSIE